MMYRKFWDVLLVDDEPDVLAISKLAMKNIVVYNAPLKIHTCGSKAEAIKFLKSSATLPDLSVAIIDVVMETDQAGLDLCAYIREELKNNITQLIVRTGQ